MDFEYEEDSQQRRPAAQEASLPFKEEEHDDASAEAAARSSSVRIGGIGVPNATIPQQTNMINVSSDLFYECAQCGEDNELKAKDAIRCRQCGYRILFKKRTNKVRNIPFGCTEEQLIEIFQEVGQVKGFHLVFDRVTGKPKGFGYCEFYDAETAASAVRNLDRREIGDRKLHVTLKGFGDDRQQQQQQQQQQQRQQQQLQSSSGIGSSSNQQSASDQITSTLTSYSTQELLNFLKDMKTYIAKNPSESRDYLKSNPQVTYTLVEALLLTNMVSKDTISKYFPLEDGSLSKSSSNSALDNIPADQMALIQQILQASPEQIEALPPDQKEYFLLIKAQMSSKP